MTGANFTSWYNQGEGTVYTEAVGINNTGGFTRRFVEIGDASFNERFVTGYSTTTSTRWLVVDGGGSQSDISVTTGVTAGSLVKMAAAYALNNFQQASNGTLGTADTAGTLPTVTGMYLGSDFTFVSAVTMLNGTIRKIAYYRKRLTNAQLQALTT
jgi:hypothetical protein